MFFFVKDVYITLTKYIYNLVEITIHFNINFKTTFDSHKYITILIEMATAFGRRRDESTCVRFRARSSTEKNFYYSSTHGDRMPAG